MLQSSSSHLKELYNPKAFFTHAALLDQGFPHCPIFPTAASRRSLGRVSVPVWLIILSDQLLIVALVSHYLTNKLIRRGTVLEWPKPFPRRAYAVLAIVSNSYSPLQGWFPRVTHPSATKDTGASSGPSFDLHVLGMPPAFILSQDQTLKLNSFWPKPRGKYKEQSCAQTYMFRITFYVT
jgi:hypothetical protein